MTIAGSSCKSGNMFAMVDALVRATGMPLHLLKNLK